MMTMISLAASDNSKMRHNSTVSFMILVLLSTFLGTATVDAALLSSASFAAITTKAQHRSLQTDELPYLNVDYGFYEGSEREPTTSEVESLLCRTERYLRDVVTPGLDDPCLVLLVQEIGWSYTGEVSPALPFLLTFYLEATSIDENPSTLALPTAEDLLTQFSATANVSSYLSEYVLNTTDSSVFYDAETMSWNGTVSTVVTGTIANVTCPENSVPIPPSCVFVTEAPTVTGATLAPTVTGATLAPTVTGATLAPTVTGATLAPTVTGATLAPTPSPAPTVMGDFIEPPMGDGNDTTTPTDNTPEGLHTLNTTISAKVVLEFDLETEPSGNGIELLMCQVLTYVTSLYKVEFNDETLDFDAVFVDWTYGTSNATNATDAINTNTLQVSFGMVVVLGNGTIITPVETVSTLQFNVSVFLDDYLIADSSPLSSTAFNNTQAVTYSFTIEDPLRPGTINSTKEECFVGVPPPPPTNGDGSPSLDGITSTNNTSTNVTTLGDRINQNVSIEDIQMGLNKATFAFYFSFPDDVQTRALSEEEKRGFICQLNRYFRDLIQVQQQSSSTNFSSFDVVDMEFNFMEGAAEPVRVIFSANAVNDAGASDPIASDILQMFNTSFDETKFLEDYVWYAAHFGTSLLQSATGLSSNVGMRVPPQENGAYDSFCPAKRGVVLARFTFDFSYSTTAQDAVLVRRSLQDAVVGTAASSGTMAQEPNITDMRDLVCSTNLYFRDLLQLARPDENFAIESTGVQYYFLEGLLRFSFYPEVRIDEALSPSQIIEIFDSGFNTEEYLNDYVRNSGEGASIHDTVDGISVTSDMGVPGDDLQVPDGLCSVQAITKYATFRINYGFFTDLSVKPTLEEVQSMMCQTENYFQNLIEANLNTTSSIDLNIMNIVWNYDAESDTPVEVRFSLNPRLQNETTTSTDTIALDAKLQGTRYPTPEMVIDIFNKTFSYQDYITDYVWSSQPHSDNVFHDTEGITWMGAIEGYNRMPLQDPSSGGNVELISCYTIKIIPKSSSSSGMKWWAVLLLVLLILIVVCSCASIIMFFAHKHYLGLEDYDDDGDDDDNYRNGPDVEKPSREGEILIVERDSNVEEISDDEGDNSREEKFKDETYPQDEGDIEMSNVREKGAADENDNNDGPNDRYSDHSDHSESYASSNEHSSFNEGQNENGSWEDE